MPEVEVVAAGNEVLLGHVLDTNSNFLCRRVTAAGGRVTRTVLVSDEVATIAAELRATLDRRPALVFTVGGLGPTDDDLTLAGVAQATGRPLQLDPEAERLVSEKYAEFAELGYVPFAEMNESRLKMARLPRGAEPVVNPVGGAPGVLLREGETVIVSLPGVPDELMAIVDKSLAELFTELFGKAHFDERALVVDLQDESAIAGILREVDDASPGVYIKSRAQPMGPDVKLRVTVSARGQDGGEVSKMILTALDRLERSIGAAGFGVTRE
jgi:molybdenum cofactor synthesis domain-containing protein